MSNNTEQELHAQQPQTCRFGHVIHQTDTHAQQPCGGCGKLREALAKVMPYIEALECSNDVAWVGITAVEKECREALAQPCQQPASARSEEWTAHRSPTSQKLIEIRAGDKAVVTVVTDDDLPGMREVCASHNAALRRQSAPVEAWRDLERTDWPEPGDRFVVVQHYHSATINPPECTGFWQRRVTQGDVEQIAREAANVLSEWLFMHFPIPTINMDELTKFFIRPINAALHCQSGPLEAWRDLDGTDDLKPGDRAISTAKMNGVYWQRRVTQGEQQS